MVVLEEERRYDGGGEEVEAGPLPLADGGGRTPTGRRADLPAASLGHRWVVRLRSGSGPTGEEVGQLDEVLLTEGPFCVGRLCGESVVLRKERDGGGLEELLGGGGRRRRRRRRGGPRRESDDRREGP